MPLVPVTSTPAIRARVVGVWDAGDHRIVQVMPGLDGGVEVGMLAQLILRADADPPTLIGERAVIESVKDRVATFTTAMPLDSISVEVAIAPAPASQR